MTSGEESNFSRILFTGDTTLTSDYWKDPACSSQLIEYIKASDLAVTNLEAPCRTENPADKFGPAISIPSSKIESIQNLGFDAVSLANNHIRDYGSTGVNKTIRECSTAGLQTFGAGKTKSEAFEPLEVRVADLKVGIAGISEHEESIADDQRSGAAWAYDAELVKRLNEWSSEYDLTFVVAHGGLEYIPIPPASWRSHLRMLAETGVDAIIAHHPHTPQGWERHHGTPIYYSLGNFLMYDSQRSSTQWSYGIDIRLNESGIVSVNPVVFSARGGVVDIVNERSGNDEYNQYLERSSAIIQNNTDYSEYWTDVASRLYSNPSYRYQYFDRLKEFGTGHLLSMASNPVLELDRLSRGIRGDAAQREKELALLDKLQCRSHRDAIQTAINSQIQNNTPSEDLKWKIDQLFKISDDTFSLNFLRRQYDRLSTIRGRFTNNKYKK